MDNCNELETYFLNLNVESLKRCINNLSYNHNISINVLVELCNKCELNYKKIIFYNPNLTIDDIETYYSSSDLVLYNLIPKIAKYCNIMSDDRIKFKNGYFYYKNFLLPWQFIKYNKYISYDFFINNCQNSDVFNSNNDFICYNPNGNFINYDHNDITKLSEHINNYCGKYDDNTLNIIIKYLPILKSKLCKALTYLPYDFIMENIMDPYKLTVNAMLYLCVNESLTIDNVKHLFNNYLHIRVYGGRHIFEYASITLEEIIQNKLHKNKNFYYFAGNRNCKISDIFDNPELNWYDVCMNLAESQYDYNYKYEFKFAD